MRILTIIVLIFSAHILWAQEKSVPVKEKFRLFKNRVSRQLEKVDSVKLPSDKNAVHLAQTDSIKKKNLFAGLKNKIDSAGNKAHQPDTIKKAGFPGSQSTDSIRNALSFPNPTKGISADSLNGKLKLPDSGIASSADSIKNKTEKVTTQVNERIAKVQDRLKGKSDSTAVPGGLGELQNKLGEKTDVKLPGQAGLPTDQIKLPSGNGKTNPSMPGLPGDAMKIPGTDPSKNLPGIPDMNLPNQKDNSGVADMKLPDSKNLSAAELPGLNASEKVKEKLNVPTDLPEIAKPDSSQITELKEKALEDERLKKYAEPVTQVSDKLDPYKKNLDSLSIKDAGNIAAKELESNATNIGGLKEIDAKAKAARGAMAMPQQAALLQRYQDKKILKEEMLRKSKNVMNDKITSMTPQIQEQQEKFGKAKRLNSSVPSVKNMTKKRTDELKSRPFYERIVPGVSLQTFTGDVFALDVSPQVSYRITTPLSVGAGMLFRVGFDKKYEYFVEGQGIYGFKTFADYRLIKGLFVHGEYEKITVTQKFDYSDQVGSSAIHSAYFGIGKRYPLSRKIYGSLMALYRVEFGDHLPGSTKFNLRVAFEYKTKKVRKPTDL